MVYKNKKLVKRFGRPVIYGQILGSIRKSPAPASRLFKDVYGTIHHAYRILHELIDYGLVRYVDFPKRNDNVKLNKDGTITVETKYFVGNIRAKRWFGIEITERGREYLRLYDELKPFLISIVYGADLYLDGRQPKFEEAFRKTNKFLKVLTV